MSRATETLPAWPAALPLHMAAAYCGLSVDVFKEVCPVKPISFTLSTRGHRYLRARLDEWLLSKDRNAAPSPARKFGDRLNGGQGEARRA